jgi:OmpA-OmpF porin, OOP family
MKACILFMSVMLMMCSFSSAQIIDVKGKIKSKSISRADQHTDEAIDKGLDGVEDGVKDIFTKDKSQDEGEENSSESEKSAKENDDNNTSENAKPEQKQEEPKLQSFTKYDFVPGDKVILFEDFSQDAVGDFPALWTTSGSGEVRTLNKFPGNWLYMNSTGNVYTLMQDLTLPDNFIIEFDIVPTPTEEGGEHSSCYMTLYQGEGEYLDDGLFPGHGGFHLTLNDNGWQVQSYADEVNGIDGSTELAPVDVNKSNHVIIWVQKRRLRVYHKGQKAVDLPTILFQQVKYNRLRFSLWSQDGYPYITNIRITSAAPDMRSKLLTEGKLVSYGIYFDINKDLVKPESYGTLKGIAQVLTENPDVKIRIVGHTDSDGADAANLDLSKRRAASVKNELVKTFAIDASRIETDGKGETVPIAPNDTPANKALNRRVEFIKL